MNFVGIILTSYITLQALNGDVSFVGIILTSYITLRALNVYVSFVGIILTSYITLQSLKGDVSFFYIILTSYGRYYVACFERGRRRWVDRDAGKHGDQEKEYVANLYLGQA